MISKIDEKKSRYNTYESQRFAYMNDLSYVVVGVFDGCYAMTSIDDINNNCSALEP